MYRDYPTHVADSYLDDLSITAIPEPGAASLTLLGCIALAFRRRR